MLGLLRRRLARSRILLLALLPRDEADAPRPREWPTVYTKVQMLYCSPRGCLSSVLRDSRGSCHSSVSHAGRLSHCHRATPVRKYTVWPAQGLSIVNERLQLYAKQHSEEVTFLDCGAIFFAGPDRLNDQLLPDALHPSAAGDEIAVQCSMIALWVQGTTRCCAVSYYLVCRCTGVMPHILKLQACNCVKQEPLSSPSVLARRSGTFIRYRD